MARSTLTLLSFFHISFSLAPILPTARVTGQALWAG
jgi:hypothetical protein